MARFTYLLLLALSASELALGRGSLRVNGVEMSICREARCVRLETTGMDGGTLKRSMRFGQARLVFTNGKGVQSRSIDATSGIHDQESDLLIFTNADAEYVTDLRTLSTSEFPVSKGGKR